MPTETENTIPSWLNDEFLEKALKSEYPDEDLKITSFSVNRATVPGDNFLSLMCRATVHLTRGGKSEKKSLIVKVQPEGETMKKATKNFKLFELEAKMLTDVLPAMHELFREANIENFTPFSAKHLYSHFGAPAHVIVLEDLKESGFHMAERTSGLDEDHCMAVMRKLGQFHAASVVLKEKKPELLELFKDPPSQYMLKDDDFRDFFQVFLKDLSDEIDKNCEELKKFTGKIRKIAETAMDRWEEGRSRNDEEFNVLIHGDTWVNNMMFCYSKDGKQITDMRFVDYQLSLWTSPAVDLLYFLNSSPATDLFKDQTAFIEEYHRVLGETLTALGYKHMHITLEHLNELIEKRGFFGMLAGFLLRNGVMQDDETMIDVDEMVKQEQMNFKFSKKYIESQKTQIPLMDEKGWLV